MAVIKGIKFEDVEAPVRVALCSFAKNYDEDRKNNIIKASDMEISFGVSRNHGAVIRINNAGKEYRVNSESEDSKGFYNFHHFLNNPTSVMNEMFDKWKLLRINEPALCNISPNSVIIEPFIKMPRGLENVDKLLKLLDDMQEEKVNVGRININGLSRSFEDFNKTYLGNAKSFNRLIGSSVSASSYNECVITLYNRFYKQNGMSLAGYVSSIEDFLKEPIFRKNISDDIIEQIYLESAKAELVRTGGNNKSLYLSLRNFIEPENFKNKQLKGWHGLYGMGDTDNFFCEKLPENLDSFFLSRSFVEKHFIFTTSSSAGKDFTYSGNEYTSNLKAFFNLMKLPSLQPLSGIKNVVISDLGGVWNCTVETKSTYDRQNFQKFANELLVELKKIAKENPFEQKEIEKSLFPDRERGMYLYKEKKVYLNKIEEWASILKFKTKLKRKIDKLEPTDIVEEAETITSFKM